MRTDNYPAVGSHWKEVDPRINRVVEVVAHDTARRKVGITRMHSIQVTWAKVERFNGKRGGYRPATPDEVASAL